jgi:hypothetical protein
MIRSETNSCDIRFRMWEHSLVGLTCQVLLGESGMILNTYDRRSQNLPSFLTQFVPETCVYGSKGVNLQGTSNTVSYDQTMNGWIAYVREEFYSIPEVEAIYVAIEENNVDIWLVIPNRDFALLRELVELEMKFLNTFIALEEPLFLFEFHIVYRCGANESKFVPKRAMRIPR